MDPVRNSSDLHHLTKGKLAMALYSDVLTVESYDLFCFVFFFIVLSFFLHSPLRAQAPFSLLTFFCTPYNNFHGKIWIV
jgi:hypothetical protein